MNEANYQIQKAKPLFPQLLWSRPMNRQASGRILLVGGHSGGLSNLQTLYQLVQAAGIGEARLAVPDVQSKLLGVTGLADFLPSSPSGSIGKGAYGQLVYLAEEYDVVVIGADLTANSQTATVVERFIGSSDARLIVTNEALDALKFNYDVILDRPNTLIITDMARISKLSAHLKLASDKQLQGQAVKADIVGSLAAASKPDYLVIGSDIITATGNDAPTITDLPTGSIGARLPLAIATAATLWTQLPERTGGALATAAYLVAGSLGGLNDTPKATPTQMAKALAKRLKQAENEGFGT